MDGAYQSNGSCTFPCSSDNSQMCGGPDAFSVYTRQTTSSTPNPPPEMRQTTTGSEYASTTTSSSSSTTSQRPVVTSQYTTSTPDIDPLSDRYIGCYNSTGDSFNGFKNVSNSSQCYHECYNITDPTLYALLQVRYIENWEQNIFTIIVTLQKLNVGLL